MCQFRVAEAKQKSEALKGAGVVMLIVFNSDSKEMAPYAGKQASPEFPLLCDKEGATYKEWQCKKSLAGSPLGCGMCYHACVDCRLPPAMCGCFNPLSCGKGHCGPCMGYANCSTQHMNVAKAQQMPADFLIDEEGKIVDLKYGGTIGSHMPWSRIESFAGLGPQQEKM